MRELEEASAASQVLEDLIERYKDMSVELYNLKEDIGEQKDLSQTNPEKTAYMSCKPSKFLTRGFSVVLVFGLAVAVPRFDIVAELGTR